MKPFTPPSVTASLWCQLQRHRNLPLVQFTDVLPESEQLGARLLSERLGLFSIPGTPYSRFELLKKASGGHEVLLPLSPHTSQPPLTH